MQPNPLTLRDYAVPIWRRRWMIAALVVVITGVVATYYARRPVTYTARTQVFVGPQADPALGIGPAEPSAEAIANEAALLNSTETAALVAKKIGYTGSPAGLAGSVSVTPSQTTNFITITASASTSAESARIVNAYATQFIDENSSAGVKSERKQIATLKKQERSVPPSARQSIQSEIQQLQLQETTAAGNASQVNVATGGVGRRKSPIEFGLLAAIGALVGGILLAFLLERLDPRLKGIQHTEMIYQHPVLATVWHDDDIAHFVDGKPALSPRSREAFRDLRIGLYLAADEHELKTIVVSSAVPDEGKSTVARNLALALSEGGRRVVLVDADLRKPSVHKGLGLKSGRGLSDVLGGTRTLDEVLVEVPIDAPTLQRDRSNGSTATPRLIIGNGTADVAHAPTEPANGAASNGGPTGVFRTLSNFPPATSTEGDGRRLGFGAQASFHFLASGSKPPNPQGALESDAFAELLDELKSRFDVVIFDSSPLTLVSDAIPVVRRVDHVLLVARSSTDSRNARHAAEVLQRVPGASVIGLVVNDVPETAAAAYGKGYGYGYYGYGYLHHYGYGYGEQPAESNGNGRGRKNRSAAGHNGS